jgi:hypothetical protein
LDKRKIQFTHNFININQTSPNSAFFYLLQPLIVGLKAKKIYRVKANLLPRTENILTNQFHVDNCNANKTAIYCINDNNGETVFYNGTKVQSRSNRMIIFDSNLYHTGTTCTDAKCRIIINFNYDD